MDLLPKDNNILYNIFCVCLAKHDQLGRRDLVLRWRTLVHGVALAHHGYVALYAQALDFSQHADPRIQDLKKYGPRYLTGWNFAFQTTFLVLALACDATEWCARAAERGAGQLRYWRDVVFNGLVVPYTLFVCGMFWGLCLVDRELVFPAALDAVVAPWFNRAVHSWVLLVVGAELVLQPRSRPADGRLQYSLCWFFSIFYAVVYYTTYWQTGRWLYPVFGVMSPWQVCLYQLGIWASMHLLYELQWPLIALLHPGVAPRVRRDPAPQPLCTTPGSS